MKKSILFIFGFVLTLITNAQLDINVNGKVGIGGVTTPGTVLHLKDNGGNCLINMESSSNYLWRIGNYISSPWGSPNTFAILDVTSSKLRMEFRPDGSYIHDDKFFLDAGRGIVHSNYFGFYANASSYDFNPSQSNTNPYYRGFIFENKNGGESSGFYCDADYAVIWSPGDGGSGAAGGYGYLLKVLDEDDMGGSNALKWYVDGDGDTYKNSDERIKENIKDISNSLEKIKSIKGVSYDFRQTEQEYKKSDSLKTLNGQKEFKKNQKVGFLAQSLERSFPDVVQTDENGYKYVNYDGIIVYLVEGMKEQQAIIEELQKEIEILKNKSN